MKVVDVSVIGHDFIFRDKGRSFLYWRNGRRCLRHLHSDNGNWCGRQFRNLFILKNVVE
jgi:hypothetical protein